VSQLIDIWSAAIMELLVKIHEECIVSLFCFELELLLLTPSLGWSQLIDLQALFNSS
jgi:hypothetical protein